MTERPIGPDPSLLDRVDGVLHSILSMPVESRLSRRQTARRASFEQGSFAYSRSLPAAPDDRLRPQAQPVRNTLLHHLSGRRVAGHLDRRHNRAHHRAQHQRAIKQRLIFRLAGSFIGGLIFALGATVFLFPHMDSITSLVVLIAAVAFLSAWVAGGRQFNYVGLQIAFSFYLVVFAGFSAPTELAPARDRLIGILLALVIMAFVFDQIWPVRTVTAMRACLATVLRRRRQIPPPAADRPQPRRPSPPG